MFENHVLDLYYYSDRVNKGAKKEAKIPTPEVVVEIKPVSTPEVFVAAKPLPVKEIVVTTPIKKLKISDIEIITAIRSKKVTEIIFVYEGVLCKWIDGVISKTGVCDTDSLNPLIKDIIPTLNFININ